MLVKISKKSDVKEPGVTDEALYRERRKFLQTSASITAMSLVPSLSMWPSISSAKLEFDNLAKSEFSANEELTPFDAVTSYNNFYELGTDKGDPKRNARHLKLKPWNVKIEGECEKTWGV